MQDIVKFPELKNVRNRYLAARNAAIRTSQKEGRQRRNSGAMATSAASASSGSKGQAKQKGKQKAKPKVDSSEATMEGVSKRASTCIENATPKIATPKKQRRIDPPNFEDGMIEQLAFFSSTHYSKNNDTDDTESYDELTYDDFLKAMGKKPID